MNIISEFNEGAWLCVCLTHICRWALKDAIKSDYHGNGLKPLFQHKDPSNVTFTVLMYYSGVCREGALKTNFLQKKHTCYFNM